MKDFGTIKHGVYRAETPNTQSEDYIIARLNDEENVAQILTPHVSEVQKKVAEIASNKLLNSDLTKILEIGTGTGTTTLAVLQMLSEVKIEAVDISESRLDRSRIRLKNMSNRVTYVLSEATEYLSGQEPNFYDCIFTAFSLHNLPIEARLAILFQVQRTLAPTGIFIDADKHGLSNPNDDELLFTRQIEIIKSGFHSDVEFAEKWIQHYHKDREIDVPREQYLIQLGSMGLNAQLVFEKGLEAVFIAENNI